MGHHWEDGGGGGRGGEGEGEGVGVGGGRGGKRTHGKTGNVIEFFLGSLTFNAPCDSVSSSQFAFSSSHCFVESSLAMQKKLT